MLRAHRKTLGQYVGAVRYEGICLTLFTSLGPPTRHPDIQAKDGGLQESIHGL